MATHHLNKISFKYLVLSAVATTFVVLAVAVASISSFLASEELTDNFYQDGVLLTKNLAENSVAPLLYGSPASAESMLDILIDIEQVSEVGVVTVDGTYLLQRQSEGHVRHDYPVVTNREPFSVIEDNDGWYFSALVVTQEVAPGAENDLFGLLGDGESQEVVGTVNLAISKEKIVLSRRNIFINNFLLSMGVALLLLVLMYGVLRNLTRPLESLSKLMEQGQRGTYQENVDNRGPREIFEMSRTFNNMIHAIREREQNLSLTLDSIGDAVIATDVDGCITRMNPVAEALTGWDFSDARGKPLPDVFQIIHAETRFSVGSPLNEILQAGSAVELADDAILLSKQGVEFNISDSGAPIRNESGAILGIILVFRDTTEECKLQAALKENQQRLQSILDNTSAVIYVKDKHGRYLLVNQQFERLFNVSNEKVCGMTDYDIFPDDIADKFRENDRQVLLTQASLKIEEPVPVGDSERTYLSIKFPLFDDKQAVNAICGISTDITERLQTEEALRRSQKMDAIGQLSGGIAHDFNNQLGVVIGYLDFLNSYTANDDKPNQWVKIAEKATLRCMDLTRQLLAFSRRHARVKKVVDINQVLRELEPMIARSVTPEVEVKYRLSENLWKTEIDAGEFQDAVLNLVINARDAMQGGGKLLLETHNVQLSSSVVAQTSGMKPGDYMQLLVTDSGSGMSKDTVEHVFEPFFTTKAEGKGTGLGMAMVYGFVQRYEGGINIQSTLGMGTTMCLYLPRSTQSEATSSEHNRRSDELPMGNERVLIVDDEIELLMLAEKYLTALGYRTHTASSGIQALQILQQDSAFDLLFSDVVMPGDMGGYDLARKAAEINPHIKILLTSGFTAKKVTNSRQAQFAANLLDKPYRKAGLAQRVRAVLDEAPDKVSVNAAHPSVRPDPLSHSRDSVSHKSLAGCRILVVDDDADVRELFQINLHRMGCVTTAVQNGEEALILCRQAIQDNAPVDIVILDLNLPGGMGGREIALLLRTLTVNPLIIVASGDTVGPEMVHCQDYGFDAAMEKDFNPQKIKQVLERVLSAVALQA